MQLATLLIFIIAAGLAAYGIYKIPVEKFPYKWAIWILYTIIVAIWVIKHMDGLLHCCKL